LRTAIVLIVEAVSIGVPRALLARLTLRGRLEARSGDQRLGRRVLAHGIDAAPGPPLVEEHQLDADGADAHVLALRQPFVADGLHVTRGRTDADVARFEDVPEPGRDDRLDLVF